MTCHLLKKVNQFLEIWFHTMEAWKRVKEFFMLPLKQVNLKAFIEGNDMTKYQGVDVDHPRIIEAVKNLVKAGKKTDEIARVVGMPHEVIRKYERDTRASNKK